MWTHVTARHARQLDRRSGYLDRKIITVKYQSSFLHKQFQVPASGWHLPATSQHPFMRKYLPTTNTTILTPLLNRRRSDPNVEKFYYILAFFLYSGWKSGTKTYRGENLLFRSYDKFLSIVRNKSAFVGPRGNLNLYQVKLMSYVTCTLVRENFDIFNLW